jgi:hypothetical protein
LPGVALMQRRDMQRLRRIPEESGQCSQRAMPRVW